MSQEKDWKEIKESINIKESEMQAEFGFDIKQNWNKRLKRNYPLKIIPKRVIIAFLIICIIVVIIIVRLTTMIYKLTKSPKGELTSLGLKVNTIYKENWGIGKKIYTYELKDIPNIHIHAVKDCDNIQKDMISQIKKYFFEKWEDKDKDKFIVECNYKDAKIGNKIKHNWLLDYNIYIKIENYEDLLEATEIILRFSNYMGKYKSLYVEDLYCNMQLKDLDIWLTVFDALTYTDDNGARENVKLQYIQYVKHLGLDYDDIPLEEIEKYWVPLEE